MSYKFEPKTIDFQFQSMSISHLALKCNLSVCLLNTLFFPDYVCIARRVSVVFVFLSISNQRSLNNPIVDGKRLALCCEIEYRSLLVTLNFRCFNRRRALSKNSN